MPTDNPQEKQLAMLAHLLAIFTQWLGPLVIWLTQKDKSVFVGEQAKEALNFQITVLLLAFAIAISGFILSFLCIGVWMFLSAPLLIVGDIICCVIAALEANKGNDYRYPFNLRLIK
ncbi:MAG: DUF4870 domain-containing protein [Verrucomicrobiales bacterium]|jgi:uncharacterized Tic20 family protein|nr:DUF4870 domain-containing protein [Verrucomicrobiales bacterium]